MTSELILMGITAPLLVVYSLGQLVVVENFLINN